MLLQRMIPRSTTCGPEVWTTMAATSGSSPSPLGRAAPELPGCALFGNNNGGEIA
jgi:hypothetical protein